MSSLDDHALAEGILNSGFTTEEQVREFLRASRESAPTNDGPPTPTPETPAPAAVEPDSPLARAQAALDAQKEADTLLAGAKAILRQQLGHEPEGFTNAELLWHAKLGPNPNESEAQRIQRERIEYENRLATDPALRGEYERVTRDRAVTEFRRAYWQLSPAQRQERIAELGLTAFTPPESFNGLD